MGFGLIIMDWLYGISIFICKFVFFIIFNN